jgi:hypothetical protein
MNMSAINSVERGVVVALGGNPDEQSPVSVLRGRVGRVIWGTETGLTSKGAPILLPNDLFDSIADRKLPRQNEDVFVTERVSKNLLRAGMVRAERAVNIGFAALSIVIGFVLYLLASAALTWQVEHCFHNGASAALSGMSYQQPQHGEYDAPPRNRTIVR